MFLVNTTIIAELSDKSRIIVKIIYPLQFWHSSLPFYKESGGTRRSIFRTKAFAPGPAAKAEFREGGQTLSFLFWQSVVQ